MTREEIETIFALGARAAFAHDDAILKLQKSRGVGTADLPRLGHDSSAWRDAEAYDRGAVVEYRGQRYVCVQKHFGFRPGEASARGAVWVRE